MTDPAEGWLQVLKTLFLEIWLYMLIIAIGILLLIGVLLGVWHSLFSDKSYRYRQKIKPTSEIESASVFVGSKVTQEEDQLPPYPRSHNQDLPPPLPSLLRSMRRTRTDGRAPKLRYHDDGYSSNSDDDRNSIHRRSLGRQDQDDITSSRAISTVTALDHGIIETHKTLKNQRQTSTLVRFALRNNSEGSLPNRQNHTSQNDGVFVDSHPMTSLDHSHMTQLNQSKCNPRTLSGRDIAVSPSSRRKSSISDSQLHRGNHDYRLSNTDNTIETRLPSNSNHSVKTKMRPNSEKISNSNIQANVTVLNLPSQSSVEGSCERVRNTIYLNQDSEVKSYIDAEKSYINNECKGRKNIHYMNNKIDLEDETIYVNQEVSTDEDDDLYTDGFAAPPRVQERQCGGMVEDDHSRARMGTSFESGTNVQERAMVEPEDDQIYENHETNAHTYHNYDAQAYTNSNNESLRTDEDNFSHLKRYGIYQNNDPSTDEDDEFMDVEDISIYMNH